MNHQTSPLRTPANPVMEAVMRWVSGTGRGQALGHWLSRTIALPQLRRLTADAIPWSPLQRPLRAATVALVTTSGVHRRDDRPFKFASDPTFRVIPRTAQAGDLAIAHQAYDRTDALRDLTLVFPLQRLREQISTDLMKDAIYLPLWNVNDPFTMAPGVSGLHTTLNGYVTFHAAALA